MGYTYETVTPPLIPNTVTQKMLWDGVQQYYKIQAADGYALHDSRVDTEGFDPDTLEPTGEIIPTFKFGSTTVPVSYDFNNVTRGTYTYTDENGMTADVPVEKVGMYALYTLPQKNVSLNKPGIE